MKKRWIALLALCLCALVPAGTALAAGEAGARVALDACDTNEHMNPEHRNAVVADDSNFVDGTASLAVTSILPNIMLPFAAPVDASAVDPASGYLELYLYFDTPELFEFTSAYSWLKLTGETPNDDRAQANSFVWNASALAEAEPGWNYVALKLSEAVFTGPKTPAEVLAELRGFFLIVWSVQKPGATSGALTGDNYYTLKANLDELAVTAAPQTFADGFDFSYHQRMEETQNRVRAHYVDDGSAETLRIVAYVLFGLAFAAVAATEAYLIVKKGRKSK